jgi:hypothetical protein
MILFRKPEEKGVCASPILPSILLASSFFHHGPAIDLPSTIISIEALDLTLRTQLPWAKAKAKLRLQLLLNALAIIPSSAIVGIGQSVRRKVCLFASTFLH